MEGNESFDASSLGTAAEVREDRVCDDDMLLIKGCVAGPTATLLLRGANDLMLDEMQRSLHDALCVVKRVRESGSVVPGGGAAEAALSVHLEGCAVATPGREQAAVAAFADALLVIPKTLAVNAAKDATELVAGLRAAHARAQAPGAGPEERALAASGLDLQLGVVRDNLRAGVLEPCMAKLKIIQASCCGVFFGQRLTRFPSRSQFATEAAITVLRIDDMIVLSPPQEQEG